MKTNKIYQLIIIILILVIIALFLQNLQIHRQIKSAAKIALQLEKLGSKYDSIQSQNDSLIIASSKIISVESAELKLDADLYQEERQNLNDCAEEVKYKEREISLLKKSLNEMESLLLVYFEIKKEVEESGSSKYESIHFGKVQTNPDKYFSDYIEIINNSDEVISKAVVKNCYGEIVKEDYNPLVLNTSRLKTGIHYVSFYNEKGELIQKAKVMMKRQ